MPTFRTNLHLGEKDPLVDNDSIADAAITTDKIADDAVTNSKLACDSVGTCQIQDGAVTIEKTSGFLSLFNRFHAEMVRGVQVNATPVIYPDMNGIVHLSIQGGGDTDPDALAALAARVAELERLMNSLVADGLVPFITWWQDEQPSVSSTQLGCLWYNTSQNKLFRAYLSDPTDVSSLAWEEVALEKGKLYVAPYEGKAYVYYELGMHPIIGGGDEGTKGKVFPIAGEMERKDQVWIDIFVPHEGDYVLFGEEEGGIISKCVGYDGALPLWDDNIDEGTVFIHNGDILRLQSDHTPETLVSSQVTTDRIKNKAVTGDKIANGAIDRRHIGEQVITNDHLAANCVTSDNIGNQEILNQHIANRTITANKIAMRTISGNELQIGTICAEHIADGEICTEHIAEGAVTDDKLASRFVKKIKVNGGTTEYAPNANGVVDIPISGGGGGDTPTPSHDGYTEIPGGTVISSYGFRTGGKYWVSGNTVLSADYTFPPDVTLLFDGGKIILGGTSSAKLIGRNTKIEDTTNQIFDVGISCEGTWDIPYARPEWWGARADAIDYGSWPFRVYGGTLDAEDIASINIIDGLPQNYETVYPHDPEVYFNCDPHTPGTDSTPVYVYANDAGLMPDYIPRQVFLDTVNMRFLFCPDGVNYYTKWKNSGEWNNETTSKSQVRTDCVFVDCEEGFSDDPDIIQADRRYYRTTKVHVFVRNSQGNLVYQTSKVRLDNTNPGHDASMPFHRALQMLNGKVTLQKDGVYLLKSFVGNDETGNPYPILITDGTKNGMAVPPEGALEGNGATLYFFPHSYDINSDTNCKCKAISIETSIDKSTNYTIRNIKCTTVRAFKGSPFSSGGGTCRRGDLACSRLDLFEIHQVTGITIENIYTQNFFIAFYVHQGRSSSIVGDSCTIRKWTSRGDYAPLHYNIGTKNLTVEDSDIEMRPYGDVEAHIFYLELHGLNFTQNFTCRRTRIYQRDGYTSAPFNCTGDNNTAAASYNQLPKHTITFDQCDIYAVRFGTCTQGVNLHITDTTFKNNGAKVAGITLKTSADFPSNFLASVTGITRIYIERSNLILGKACLMQNESEKAQNQFHLIDSRVESAWNQDAYDSVGTQDESSTAFGTSSLIRAYGTLVMKHNVILAPYAPIVGLAASNSSSENLGKGKNFIATDNVIKCAGYFFSSFRTNWLTRLIIDNNQITIDRLKVVWRWKSVTASVHAAFLTNYDTRDAGDYTSDDYGTYDSTLEGAVITDNELLSGDANYPVDFVRGIEETGYDRISGNTIDGTEYPTT